MFYKIFHQLDIEHFSQDKNKDIVLKGMFNINRAMSFLSNKYNVTYRSIFGVLSNLMRFEFYNIFPSTKSSKT